MTKGGPWHSGPPGLRMFEIDRVFEVTLIFLCLSCLELHREGKFVLIDISKCVRGLYTCIKIFLGLKLLKENVDCVWVRKIDGVIQ